MAKIASPLEPLFAGPVLSADRVEGWDTMVADLTATFGDFDAPVYVTVSDGVAAMDVGKPFYALAPAGDAHEGEKRLYLRTEVAPFYEDQGDRAAPLSPSIFGPTAITVDRMGHIGAAANGVSDDRAFFEALAAGAGTSLQLARGRRYYVSAPISWSRDIDIDLNGSTVICPNGFLDVASLKASNEAVVGVSVVKGDYSFAVPAGVVLAAGDLVRLESNDLFCPEPAANPYKFGQYTTIVAVSGGVARMADPAVGSYAVNRIYVFNPLKVGVRNGTLDMSGSPNPVGSDFPAVGVVAKAEDIRFESLRLIGGDYSGKGLIAEGRIVRARDVHASSFLNVNGYGTGGGRWGYGMDLAGEDVIADGCIGQECKHFIANGPRNFVTRNYRLINCVGRNTKGDHTRTVSLRDGSTELRYLAPFDAHGGVFNFIVDGGELAGVNNLVSNRARNLYVRGLRMTSYGVRAGNPNHYLIGHFEQVFGTVYIQLDAVAWDPGVSAGGNNAADSDRHVYIFGISSTTPGAHGDVILDLPATGGPVRWMEAQNNADTDIRSVTVRCAGGTWNGGLRLGGLGAVAIGDIGWIDISGRADFRTAGTVLPKALYDIQCASLGSIRVRGDFDGNTTNGPAPLANLGNLTDAMVLPTVMDFRDCRFTAMLTAFGFYTTSTAPAGKAMFDGAKINFHGGGLALAGQAVNAVMGAVPTEPWTFDGAAFDDSATAQANSQDVRWLANSYVDLSGATLTKDPALGNADPKVLPVRCRKKDGSFLSLRQQGEASPYLIDYMGAIYSAALPTYTKLPVGREIRNSAPASGAAPSWICVTANASGGWRPLANIP